MAMGWRTARIVQGAVLALATFAAAEAARADSTVVRPARPRVAAPT